MIGVVWGAATHVGCIRSSNQDAVITGPTVWAVADGMGGHAAGEVASALAVETLATLDQQPSLDDLVRTVQRANEVILDDAEAGSGREGMGTTVTGVSLVRQDDRELIAIFNVGDSRTYRHTSTTLSQVTVDHSLVEEMIRDGSITPVDASTHPARNVVTRALGLGGMLEVDVWTDRPALGTTYLICSDGLVNEVEDAVLDEVLGSGGSPQEVADALVALAVSAGARDNVSVVVATIDSVDELGSADDDTNPRGLLPLGAPGDSDESPGEIPPSPAVRADGLLLGPPPVSGRFEE